MHSLYDVSLDFSDNCRLGPFFTGQIPKRRLFASKEKFLDFELNSCIGVPACAVTLSKGIALLAALGFDVLTYKTIRAHPHPAHPFPHLTFIETDGQLTKAGEQKVQARPDFPSLQNLTVANSLGIGSADRHFLESDIARAKASIGIGQILIVSVYGEAQTLQDTIAQFCNAASLARQAGADVIEANFSCPNLFSCEAPYLRVEDSFAICKALKTTLGATPFIVKTGCYPSYEQMRQSLTAFATAGAVGVCGINSVRKQVIDPKGEAFFGESRQYAGVSGAAIRPLALEFVHWARQINSQEKLGLKILATGGVTQTDHFKEFFGAGADVVLSATGTIWDPYLAFRYHQTREKKAHE